MDPEKEKAIDQGGLGMSIIAGFAFTTAAQYMTGTPATASQAQVALPLLVAGGSAILAIISAFLYHIAPTAPNTRNMESAQDSMFGFFCLSSLLSLVTFGIGIGFLVEPSLKQWREPVHWGLAIFGVLAIGLGVMTIWERVGRWLMGITVAIILIALVLLATGFGDGWDWSFLGNKTEPPQPPGPGQAAEPKHWVMFFAVVLGSTLLIAKFPNVWR